MACPQPGPSTSVLTTTPLVGCPHASTQPTPTHGPPRVVSVPQQSWAWFQKITWSKKPVGFTREARLLLCTPPVQPTVVHPPPAWVPFARAWEWDGGMPVAVGRWQEGPSTAYNPSGYAVPVGSPSVTGRVVSCANAMSSRQTCSRFAEATPRPVHVRLASSTNVRCGNTNT
jgi:hypothetical protein